MNKSSLKTFAIWGRNELRENVRIKLEILGINEKGITEGDTHNNLVSINGFEYNKGQYDSLIKKYNDLGYTELVEEVAYTWFNRLTALAYMEINEYSDDRLIYSTTSKIEPDIMDNYMEADFFEELSQDRKNMIHDLKDTHKLEEMYSILIEEKCHDLSKIMPFMFEKSSDYTELLFPSGLLLEDSFLVKLREEIQSSKDEETGLVPVELIGWLYQFYNSEKKDEVFEGLKKNQKITKENIPAATQLFTPKWIVKYMAENSLGKLAVESLGVSEKLKSGWKYYIDTVENEELKVESEKIAIEDIKILDPAMGSGHMLTYSFDLLYDIYEDLGWSSKEAVLSILKNNIYGLEIDDRAGMLASFAVMMKAREKFRRLFRVLDRLDEEEKVTLNTLAIQESNGIGEQTVDLIIKSELRNLNKLIEDFKDAKEYGSILKLDIIDNVQLTIEKNKLKEIYQNQGQMGIFAGAWNFEEDLTLLNRLIQQGSVMASKYDVTITNPPYMGGKGYSPTLKKYVEKKYKDSKSDLFAVFMEKCKEFTMKNKYTAMIVMPSWLFLSSFEKLRYKIIEEQTIESLLHMGRGIFGIDWGSVAFVLKNEENKGTLGSYYRLHKRNFQHIKFEDIGKIYEYSKDNLDYKYDFDMYRDEDGTNEIPKEGINTGQQIKYQTSQKDFSKIPGSPIAYWVSDRVKDIFSTSEKLGDVVKIGSQNKTANNDKFLRFSWEIEHINYGINKKWNLYSKGGSFRKWYGNTEVAIDWSIEAKQFYQENKTSNLINSEYWFKTGIGYNDITSGNVSMRKYDSPISDMAGPVFLVKEQIFLYLIGYLNTKFINKLSKLLNPTLHLQVGDLKSFPLIISMEKIIRQNINILTQSCISIAREEWDSRETSWDFELSPLVPLSIHEYSDSDQLSKSEIWSNRGESTENELEISKDSCSLVASIKKAVECYEKVWRERFFQMHSNEEELNRLFIDIYGLQDEMDEKVELKDITLLKKEKKLLSVESEELKVKNENLNEAEKEQGKVLTFDRSELVKQFLSYAVGCIMGRYSIDKPGLIMANSDDDLAVTSGNLHVIGQDGETRHTIESPRFIPDAFGVIPVTNERVFENDIVTRIEEFVKVVYGSENSNENLEFIGTHLDMKKGESPREAIRRYFIKDFYKDHLQRYKKRPIYWMVNSGKKEGFSALVYMHRYRDNTIGRVRTDYLNRYQETMENILDSNSRRLGDEDLKPKDKKVIEREIKAINGQIDELRKFALDIKDIADRKIVIDLDDGVKVNYAKFGKILKKI
ncbi:BREX-1 system adenine-specific DNA-methyltransferase PglX [Psychrilyobacter sp.]|uniref:BREX-1 system adenine-specific DNA-methyltransferase PglX n=1 Tax=Psychrilyobacter sp. TaxID=2586924 RepID=UPI003019BD0F